MQAQSSSGNSRNISWISLPGAAGFLLRYPKLVTVSLILVVCTGLLTWLFGIGSLYFIDSLVGDFFQQPPESSHFWSKPLVWGWVVLKWLFFIVTRVVAFYLAFVLAYCVTSPGYVFLSYLAGNRFTGLAAEGEASMTVRGICIDLIEGVKIGLVGFLVTCIALLANFIPVIGQATAFLIYVFYSSLMFIDFPASRYRWRLGQKIRWVTTHREKAFRLGLLPAAISMIPFVNILFMALFMPLFTVHTTLNFLTIEGRR